MYVRTCQPSERLGESIRDFARAFPTEDAALKHLFDKRFGSRCPCRHCGRPLRWNPGELDRKCFLTACCGRNFHPRAGTFASCSNIELRKWFLGLLLFSNANGMISTKFLGRHLGLSDKSSRRIAKWIRAHHTALALLGRTPLEGTVYIDEMTMRAVTDDSCTRDAPVQIFGIASAQEVRFFCIPNRKWATLLPIIERNVVKGTRVVADGLAAYDGIGEAGYVPSRVYHSRGQWVNERGDCTAMIETCWRTLRYRIQGVHRHVRSDYLWSYIGQQMFIINCRKAGLSPFWESVCAYPPVRTLVGRLRGEIDLRTSGWT